MRHGQVVKVHGSLHACYMRVSCSAGLIVVYSGFSVGFCINEEKVICYQL